MLRCFQSSGSNVKTAHIDWSFVVYIDTGNPVLCIPSKSRDQADEHNKMLTEWKWFDTTVLPLWFLQTFLLSSLPVFSGVRVTRSLALCVCFADRCLSFCTFSFGHFIVCSSSIYGFWLPFWYFQTLLKTN